MKKIIGHQRQVQFLHHQLQEDNLAQVYLFVGPPFIGKFTLAQNLAQTLLRTEEEALRLHPDFLLIAQSEEAISIETILELQRKISLKPVASSKKIVIIEEASRMTLDAQNAFLKTLEEPPAYLLFFLIAQRESLLPTILSRCQRLYFQPLARREIETAGFSPFLAHLSQGQIGRLFLDPRLAEKWQGVLEHLSALIEANLKDKMDYFRNRSEEDLFFLRAIFRTLLYWQIQPEFLSFYPQKAKERLTGLARRLTLEQVIEMLDSLEEIESLSWTNVNQKLLLEELALKI